MMTMHNTKHFVYLVLDRTQEDLAEDGKTPVGAYKRVEALQFFSCFQNNSYRIINGWQLEKMKKSIPDMSLP